jgi:cytochrome c5
MKPEERKHLLDRALSRLGNVPPEVLGASRERIRRNLKTGRRPMLVPLPDATPASLGPLRRPFQIAGAAAILVLIAIGAAVRWRPEVRNVSKTPPISASRQLPESSRDTTPTLPPPAAQPPVVRRARRQPETAASKTGARPAAPEPPPVQPFFTRAQFTLLPPGDGKLILDRACVGCHRAAAVGALHYATKAEYAALVSRMIGMGAPVSEQEADVLVEYLFDNLRIKPEAPVDTDGRAILERACTSCHSVNGIEKYAYPSEGSYRALISAMISYGAVLSDEEKTTLAQYLFAAYGKR